ncbi:MAG: D-alanyl-D-alanine carboxypeptidase family protein [Anaerocolumna sp.]
MKKIVYIVISLIVLYFTSISYYEGLIHTLQSGNQYTEKIINSEETEKENSLDSKESEIKDGKSDADKMEDLRLYAQSAVLMDADNSRVLYEKNGNKEMPMASTTKIMTCIVVLENADLNDVVTVSKYASTMPDVQLNIVAGEQYRLEDFLYSLMLESHNDVAVAIAEHVGGSVEGFAEMMNAKAKELGCRHTNFVTPNGLDSNEHYTTAVELAKIASYAIKNKEFLKITNTSAWQFKELKKGRSFSVSNKDRFLYLYDGAIGVKTGFTGKAGYCFVGAVDKGDKTFVSVVLACGWPPHKSYKWSDTVELMDYGMDNYERRQIFNANKVFDPVMVEAGKENYVNLYCKGDISLLMSKEEAVKVVYKVPKALKAPVAAESVVGSAKYYVGKDLIEDIPILTSASIEKIDFGFSIKKIWNIWLGH